MVVVLVMVRWEEHQMQTVGLLYPHPESIMSVPRRLMSLSLRASSFTRYANP